MSAASPGTQRGRLITGTSAGLGVLFAAALAIGVNYLAARHYRRFDWTHGSVYTLSGKTLRVLRNLRQDVHILAFGSQGDPQNDDLRETILRYDGVSPRVHAEWIDPDQQRERFRLMQQRYEIQAGRLPDGRVVTDTAVIVESGDRHWIITPDDMSEAEGGGGDEEDPMHGGGGPRIVAWKAEGVLTGGILQVTEARQTRVCFTKGHGEWGLDDFGPSGLAHVKDDLRHENWQVEEIETRGRAQIASDCDVVVIAGPERPFPEEDANLVKEYLQRGGNVLLLLEPTGRRTEIFDTGFEPMLRWAGIEVQRNFVVEMDTGHRLPEQPPVTFMVNDFGTHPVTDPFRRGGLVIFSTARSVRRDEHAGSTFTPVELFKTSRESWGETDLGSFLGGSEPTRGPGEIQGPVSLAAAVETGEVRPGSRRRGGRMIVVGCVRFLSRGFYDSNALRNRDVTLSMLAWLGQREALIDIAPKRRRETRIEMTSEQYLWNMLYTAGILPLAAAGLGVWVWWRRRT